ncbi:MAG: hypothetical protein A3K03_04985 [Bdellovibrionales bacterium RIFOXYD1_FULL_44_7]|nr:MAG: hypothetical protein A3K03_04985 [Bdellovibrionales bacterium RIFOXYD1_FULL_44_7]
MDENRSPLITAENISRTFRSAKKESGFRGTVKLLFRPQYQVAEALKKINFSIMPGSFVGLIGANGAGKTTLLKILSGLIPPTTGQARVLGFEPFSRTKEFRKQIALVMGQKAQLWWDLPALDAFDLIRAIYEIPSSIYKKRLDLLTDLLDVQAHLGTQIRRLSLGERMKMEIIGALLHWPKVVFLDEPTIGLDVLAAHKLRKFLLEFNRIEKATIILTSHNMEDIERLCPRILILRSGELIYDGPPARLTEKGVRRLRVRLIETPTITELSQASGVAVDDIRKGDGEEIGREHSESDAFYFSVKHEEVVRVLESLLKRFRIVDMGLEEESLERVIHRIYEGKI